MKATVTRLRTQANYMLPDHLARLVRVEAAERGVRPSKVAAEIFAKHFGVRLEPEKPSRPS